VNSQLSKITQQTGRPYTAPPMAGTLKKKILTLDIKLSGALTYPEWINSLETYLDLMDIPGTKYQIWDMVKGKYKIPDRTNCKNYDSYCEWCTALEDSLEFASGKRKYIQLLTVRYRIKSLRGKTRDPEKQLTQHIYPPSVSHNSSLQFSHQSDYPF